MLTDIFADRYANRPLWQHYTQAEAKLLTQCFRNVAEQVLPYWLNGKENETNKAKWKALHDKLSMELGVSELAPTYYSYRAEYMGKPHTNSGFYTMDVVCKAFVTASFPGGSADRFIKERLSFIEIAFRMREQDIAAADLDTPEKLAAARLMQSFAGSGLRIPGDRVEAQKYLQNVVKTQFAGYVDELNTRFKQAGAPLNYHNGFIQIAGDVLVEATVERPFWQVVADARWKNVDIDMKEAIDRRDSGDRDPALYAAKALESTIKIISGLQGWTHGGEKGAHAFIDNLGAAKNGQFIERWEANALKAFFTSVRNPLGHGPGGEPMPELSPAQTSWAIESCMSWIKALVFRFEKTLTPPTA